MSGQSIGPRRGMGTLEITVFLILALVAFVIVVGMLTGAHRKFSDQLHCVGPDDDPDALVCKPEVDGCGAAGSPMLGKSSCGAGRICCKNPDSKSTAAPGVNTNSNTITADQTPPATFSAVDTATRRPIPESSTIIAASDQTPKTISLDIDLPKCDKCSWEYEYFHMTRSEYKIPGKFDKAVVNPPDAEKKLQDIIAKSLTLETSAEYIGETITYTLLITPISKNDKNVDVRGTTQRFTFRYKVTSPVSVTPLSSDWQKSKTVVASCPECRAIFYKIQESSERCAPLDKSQVDGKAKPIPIKYCLVQDKQVIRCEFNTIDACYAAVDTGASQQSQIIEVLQTASQQKILSDVEMLQFATLEQETSPRTCQLDLSVESGRQYMNTPLNATFNIEQQRATIYLDRNFMSEQYLCVYGQDLRDETRFYTAGRPQLIKIDTVPPTATIKFAPLTRKLTFSCEDDKSGCKQTYWIQYISDITKFLPALMNGGGQSAAVWCPSYATANNWRLETKREVVYTANEVRVLCLRVEDNAGNAGVTKSMVYNGYDLLQTLITEYAERQ